MSSQSDVVLLLGKKIVDEMGIQRSVDTLGRWMAHYIAELIVEANSAQGQTKIDAEKRCQEAILELWQHRYELPEGFRPFQGFEAIAETLASLDLTPEFPRYFDESIRNAARENEPESAQWPNRIGFGCSCESADSLLPFSRRRDRARSGQRMDGNLRKRLGWAVASNR